MPKDQVVGFLVIGTLANQAWNATVWASGFALQMAAYQGTLPAILASPANRLAVVTGYGVGDMVLSAPSVLVTLVAGVLIGANFDVASIPAAVAAFVMLFVSALAVGLACAGLFILSRNANPMANFLQTPIYILAGSGSHGLCCLTGWNRLPSCCRSPARSKRCARACSLALAGVM